MGDRKLSDWLEGYSKLVYNTEPPELFKVWSGIGVLAACLQRRCWIDMERIIYPNMYIILCGPSGIGKDTAMYNMVDLCQNAGLPMAADSCSREALIQDLKDCVSSYMLPDTVLPTSQNALSIIAPEFAVFLGFDNKELISALCAWYDCRKSWKYKTISRKEEIIESICVNVMGGTVPELVQKLMPLDIVGTGLASRILFVYGDKPSKIVALPIKTKAEKELYQVLLQDLQSVLSMCGEFKLSAEFIEAYVPWYEQQKRVPIFQDYNFQGYNSRRALHVRKLSMLMSASRSNEMLVRLEDFQRAIAVLEATEVDMPKVFRGAGRVPTAAILPRVQTVIGNRKVVTKKELMTIFYNDLTPDELEGILKTLEEIGYARCKFEGNNCFVHYTYGVKGEGNE